MVVSLLTFDNFALLPESINFGEAETREIPKQVEGGGLYRIKAFRANLSLAIQGVNDIEAAYYIGAAQNLSDLRDRITYGGKTITNCYLVSAAPKGFMSVGDRTNVDTLELVYESRDWSNQIVQEIFQGFTIDLDGIKYTDGESVSVQYADGAIVRTATIKKRKLSITIKGSTPQDYSYFLNILYANPVNPPKETFTLGGITLKDAILTSVVPSAAINSSFGVISDTLTLEYESRDYDVPYSQGTFQGYPIANISIGADTKVFALNQPGIGRRDVTVYKRKASFNLIGTPASLALGYVQIIDDTSSALYPPLKDITIAGYRITDAVLTNVVLGETVFLAGQEIRSTLQLEYTSRYWSYDPTGGGAANFFDGYEIDSVSFGEVDGNTVQLNFNGSLRSLAIARTSITFTLVGVKADSVTSYRSVAAASRGVLLYGGIPTLRNLNFLGVTLNNCYLINASASGKEYLFGSEKHVDSLSLIYESFDWDY
ncbi:hypothetical protein [Pseudanabaena sp. 'Roaring Creek']|uniref:hypothetical protein n=1 Tax=Pseudanabaena sp. 'Roaring Creek' TaxID=1681830 RepID=UPI0006D7ED93|nr:hypothetical protein [Pseudanabaena sp. 'Roaring Creek']